MHQKKPTSYFISWKATFERWGWYLLISFILWFFTAFLNQGYFSFPKSIQYVEVGFTWLFLESLHWFHRGITRFFIPRIINLHKITHRIFEVISVWLAGIFCLFFFNFLPNVLVFGSVVYSAENTDNLRVAFTIGPITSIWLYYFVERTRARERLQKEYLRISRLEKENYQAQLQALKNQVNPHFLFNNLNVLAAIIPEDSTKALTYTHNLSDLYRYYLQSAQKDLINLEEEIKNLEAYQFLLKTRLGSQLRFSITNNINQTQHFYLPPLVLQECIENAVKHNKATKNNPLHIHINIQSETVQVINNKAPKSTPHITTKTGWKNIKKRYNLLGGPTPKIDEDENMYKVILPLFKQE